MSRPRILVVDDEPELRSLLDGVLRRAGFDVDQAEDGGPALEVVGRRRPDLIIADILMPRVDGWELCRRLRQVPATAKIPIIFLSSRNRVPDRVRALELGADDFLAKPFDTRELVARVQAVLRRVGPVDRPAAGSGISGNLRDMNLVDIAQVLDLGRKTATVRIRSEERGGAEVGTLHFLDGWLVHATFGAEAGEEALPGLLVFDRGQFEITLGDPGSERTLTRPTQELLLDALRKADEAAARRASAQAHGPAPSPDGRPEASGLGPAVDGGSAVQPDRLAVAAAGAPGEAERRDWAGRAGPAAAAPEEAADAAPVRLAEASPAPLRLTLLDLFALGVIEPKR